MSLKSITKYVTIPNVGRMPVNKTPHGTARARRRAFDKAQHTRKRKPIVITIPKWKATLLNLKRTFA